MCWAGGFDFFPLCGTSTTGGDSLVKAFWSSIMASIATQPDACACAGLWGTTKAGARPAINHILKQSITSLFCADGGNDQTLSYHFIGQALQKETERGRLITRCFRRAGACRQRDQLSREVKQNRSHTPDRNFQSRIHRCVVGYFDGIQIPRRISGT
jgi:hypothetical protein